MKNLILITLLLFGFIAYSQCEKIKPIYDEMKDETIISSPNNNNNFNIITGMPKNNYELVLQQRTNKKGQFNIIRFIGYGFNSLIGQKGLYIKFSNNEIIILEEVSISSNYLSKNMYSYIVSIEANDKLLSLIKEYYITNFDISVYKYKIKEKDYKLYKEYANCIFQ